MIEIKKDKWEESYDRGENFIYYPKKDVVKTYNGNKIPFDNNFFNFTISDCVMDSMPFELAKKLIKEIDRVTKRYFFLSLISLESNGIFNQLKSDESFTDEIEVEDEHEKGTIQSFYNMQKIERLIENTNFKIIWCEKHILENVLNNNKHGRYYLVLEKEIF